MTALPISHNLVTKRIELVLSSERCHRFAVSEGFLTDYINIVMLFDDRFISFQNTLLEFLSEVHNEWKGKKDTKSQTPTLSYYSSAM